MSLLDSIQSSTFLKKLKLYRMSAENRLETVIALLRSHLNKNLKEIGLLLGNAKISPNYELVEEQYLGLPLWWAGDVIERKRNFVFFQFFLFLKHSHSNLFNQLNIHRICTHI